MNSGVLFLAKQQRLAAIRVGRSLVGNALAANSGGLTTDELHQTLLKTPPDEAFQSFVHLSHKDLGHRLHHPRQPMPAPPNPEHPIRSKNFLKQYILSELQQAKKIRSHDAMRTVVVPVPYSKKKKAENVEPTYRDVKVRVWKPIDQNSVVKKQLDAEKPKSKRVPLKLKAFGVGADISHLNKRRQRKRLEKVNRDVHEWKERKHRHTLQLAAQREAKAKAIEQQESVIQAEPQ